MEADQLSALDRAEVFRLCNEAYGEDVSHMFAACTADAHALARDGRVLVGHGMMVTRWLQAGTGPVLRTAYLELVATAEDYRKQGIGAGITRKLAEKAAGEGYNPEAPLSGRYGSIRPPGLGVLAGATVYPDGQGAGNRLDGAHSLTRRTGDDTEAASDSTTGLDQALVGGMASGRGTVASGPEVSGCGKGPRKRCLAAELFKG